MDTKFTPVHTNHFQVSGNNWQTVFANMDMVKEEDLFAYEGRQNLYIGDDSLMQYLPKWVQKRLWEKGGSVEWQETYDTESWAGTGAVVVNSDKDCIFSETYECHK